MNLQAPILAGAAQVSDSDEALVLMAAAARAAASDADAPDLLGAIDAVIIPRGTWPYADPGRALARELGSPDARTILTELGISQQGLINEALELVAGGGAEVALVVGGESRRFERNGDYSGAPGTPDINLTWPPDIIDDVELEAGMVFPAVRPYAAIERAFSHGQGLDDAGAAVEIGALWEAMNKVAQTNPIAAFATPRTAKELSTPSSSNPILAAPYLRWHASQWTVDQAAALLITTVGAARRFGVDPARVLHPHVAIESTHVMPLIRRAELGRWPAMAVLGAAAEAWLGYPLRSMDVTEIYSCFPAAVRVQAAELAIDLDPAPTVTGGMAFAGGPFNNFVFHATSSVADELRRNPGSFGLVTTVSGLLTKPGLAVWSTVPPKEGALIADLAEEAAAATATLDVDPAPTGPVRIETATAFVDNDVPIAAYIGRTTEGRRALIRIEGEAAYDEAVASASIGESIQAS